MFQVGLKDCCASTKLKVWGAGSNLLAQANGI